MISVEMGGSMYPEVRTSGFHRSKALARLDPVSNYSTTPTLYTRSRSVARSLSSCSSPDSSPSAGAHHISNISNIDRNSSNMKDDQLPSIRSLFPFFDGTALERSRAQQSQQPPQAPPQLPPSAHSPGALPDYTLAGPRRSTAASIAAEDDTTAHARPRGHAYRHSNSFIPRMYSDMPLPASSDSVSSSRRSSSGYGSTDRGRSFESPPRDQLPTGFPPRHAFAGPSHAVHAAEQQSYHLSSQSNAGPSHSQGQLSAAEASFQHHPSRMQSRSSDMARGYPPQPHHQHHHHQQQAQQHYQHHHYQHEAAQSHGYRSLNEDYNAVRDYYTAHHRSHHQSDRHGHSLMSGHGHGTSMGLNASRMRQDSILKKKRGNLPKEKTDVLIDWLKNNLDHPYPADEQKQEFIRLTDLDMNQISNWFINARRRKLPELLRARERSRCQMPMDMN